MSILGKNWKIKNDNADQNVAQKILENRGLRTQPQIQEFLKISYKKGLHNPFLIKNMLPAVERIAKAIEKQEKIMIFGDYDVDGISGTAILVHTLRILGAKISYRLPHRMEDGYGLSEKFIEEFASLGVRLLITVDCGVSCASQIALAADKNIDVIVTDHHTIPEQFPVKAFAVIHPLQEGCEYPFKGLTGAGVSFKLASALLTDRLEKEKKEEFLYSLLDLASLGTVADLGPLVDENRIIVKYGLLALRKTRWPGLNYLKEYAGINLDGKMDITDIGFKLGPRINAAGRIDTPYYALQLLLYDQPDEKGRILAEHLDKLNQRRQQMVAVALSEAEERFAGKQKSDKIFIAWSPDWHVGILGLIASKIAEKYMRPAVVMQDFGNRLIASARSPENFNIVSALTEYKHLLENFGGHAQAAGFSIKKEKLEKFVDAITSYAENMLQIRTTEKDLLIDCEITESDINDKLMKLLEQMEPYGIGNEQPVFLLKRVYPNFVHKVGKQSQHLHFQIEGKTRRFPVIAFKLGEHEEIINDGQPIDIAFNLTKNEWKGSVQLQLRAIDFKRSA